MPLKTIELNNIKSKMMKRLAKINDRCSNTRSISFYRYGGRGIRCFLTVDDLITLWERDCAEDMTRPSIDRIDNDGDYEFDNCRFIETAENSSRVFYYKQSFYDESTQR